MQQYIHYGTSKICVTELSEKYTKIYPKAAEGLSVCRGASIQLIKLLRTLSNNTLIPSVKRTDAHNFLMIDHYFGEGKHLYICGSIRQFADDHLLQTTPVLFVGSEEELLLTLKRARFDSGSLSLTAIINAYLTNQREDKQLREEIKLIDNADEQHAKFIAPKCICKINNKFYLVRGDASISFCRTYSAICFFQTTPFFDIDLTNHTGPVWLRSADYTKIEREYMIREDCLVETNNTHKEISHSRLCSGDSVCAVM
jgi:hypothetical protein